MTPPNTRQPCSLGTSQAEQTRTVWELQGRAGQTCRASALEGRRPVHCVSREPCPARGQWGVIGPRRPTESAPDGAHSSWSELQQPGIHTCGRCQLFAFPGAVARLGTHHRVGPSLYPRSTQFSSHIVVSTLNFKKHLRWDQTCSYSRSCSLTSALPVVLPMWQHEIPLGSYSWRRQTMGNLVNESFCFVIWDEG